MFFKGTPSEKKYSQDNFLGIVNFSKFSKLKICLSICLQSRACPMWPTPWEKGLKLRKIWGFIVSMAFKLKEMQPLSIKYFVLIYGACEETILLLNDH
jgi:hypothetical protein